MKSLGLLCSPLAAASAAFEMTDLVLFSLVVRPFA